MGNGGLLPAHTKHFQELASDPVPTSPASLLTAPPQALHARHPACSGRLFLPAAVEASYLLEPRAPSASRASPLPAQRLLEAGV